MKIEISHNDASNIIVLLEEQNQNYRRCILNLVGEREMWEACIARNLDLIKILLRCHD